MDLLKASVPHANREVKPVTFLNRMKRNRAAVIFFAAAIALVSTAEAQDKITSKKPIPNWSAPASEGDPKVSDQGIAESAVSFDQIKEFLHSDLKSAEFIRQDKFGDAVRRERNVTFAEAYEGQGEPVGGQSLGFSEPQEFLVAGCSLSPVNTTRVSFTPVKFCEGKPIRLTDVSATHHVVGHYRRQSDGRYHSFRLLSQVNGGYSDVKVLSNGPHNIPGADSGTLALGLSANGQVIVGMGHAEGGQRPIRWQSINHAPTMLSKVPCQGGNGCDLPTNGSSDKGEATATNIDGSVIVGSYSISGLSQHFRARRWVVNPVTGAVISSQQIPDPVDGSLGACVGSGAPSGAYSGYGVCMSFGYGVNSSGNSLVGFYRHRIGGGAAVARPSLPFLWYLERSDTTVLPRLFTPTSFSWQAGSGDADLASGARATISGDLGLRPHGKANAISADGWSIVGSDTTGSAARNSYPSIFYPRIPTLLTGALPSDTDLAVDPDDGGPSGVISVGRTTEDGFRWRPTAYRGTAGVMTPMRDVEDEYFTGLASNFSRSIYNDTSNGGCRTVGKSYAGGMSGFPDAEFLETAVVRPGIDCATESCRKSQRLKTEVNRIMGNGRGIDANNPMTAAWQLTEATGISPDGKTIIGNAICHQQGQVLDIENQVGFIVEIKS